MWRIYSPSRSSRSSSSGSGASATGASATGACATGASVTGASTTCACATGASATGGAGSLAMGVVSSFLSVFSGSFFSVSRAWAVDCARPSRSPGFVSIAVGIAKEETRGWPGWQREAAGRQEQAGVQQWRRCTRLNRMMLVVYVQVCATVHRSYCYCCGGCSCKEKESIWRRESLWLWQQGPR